MLKIYNCTHSQIEVIDSKWIDTICMGGLESLNCLSDNSGNNISHLNPFFNEITAQYWVRHNRPSNHVGFFHYRRWLSFIPLDSGRAPEISADYKEVVSWVNRQAQHDYLIDILQYYDIILPRRHFFPFGIKHTFLAAGNIRPVIWDTFEAAVGIYQPKQKKMFKYLDLSQFAYMRNMYVTTWDIFCAYFDDLFPILMHVFNNLSEVDKNHAYWRRSCGYLAERYLNLWIHSNRLRVREATLLNILPK